MNDNVEVQAAESEVPILDPAIESEARSGGWKPKEQFSGPDEQWIDAETFVKRGREINPILRKNNERLQKELDGAKGKLQELELTTKEFASEFAKMKENAYQRAIADLKAQRREAFKDDDHDLADELEERIDGLRTEQAKIAKKPEEEKKAPPAPDLTEFHAWQRENKWYDFDREPDMYDLAEGISSRLRHSEPDLKGRAFLDRVTEIIKKKFPEKFENPRREKAPHEGGSARGATKGKRSYSGLPADARSACDRYVKQGIMTQEQYLETYQWED